MSDTELRRRVYRTFAETGRGPAPAEDELEALARGNIVVERGRIRIANPFSGVPTGHVTHANGRSWYANCVWDGLGILAALGTDGAVDAEGLELEVRNGELVPTRHVVHFLVPAPRWYDDLVFT